MRPVILVLIGLALAGLIRPPHTARAQAPAPSGTAITIAGNGVGGFSGDGGLATDASFNGPSGLAIRPDGVFHFVRRIDAATGNITTVSGGGTNPRALISSIRGAVCRGIQGVFHLAEGKS